MLSVSIKPVVNFQCVDHEVETVVLPKFLEGLKWPTVIKTIIVMWYASVTGRTSFPSTMVSFILY